MFGDRNIQNEMGMNWKLFKSMMQDKNKDIKCPQRNQLVERTEYNNTEINTSIAECNQLKL